MVRGLLALALIGNGILFAAGVFRSVQLETQAFHRLGELFGQSGGLFDIWAWPVILVVLCFLLALVNRRKPPNI